MAGAHMIAVHCFACAFQTPLTVKKVLPEAQFRGHPEALQWRELGSKDSKKVSLVQTGVSAAALPRSLVSPTGTCLVLQLRGWFRLLNETGEGPGRSSEIVDHSLPVLIEAGAGLAECIELSPGSLAVVCDCGYKRAKGMLCVSLEGLIEPLAFADALEKDFEQHPALVITGGPDRRYGLDAVRMAVAGRKRGSRSNWGFFALLLNPDGRLTVDETSVQGPAIILGGPDSSSIAQVHTVSDAVYLDPR